MTPEELREIKLLLDFQPQSEDYNHLAFRLAGMKAVTEIERLQSQLATARERLAKIVVTEGVDAGVVLLSYDGTSHDEETITPNGQKMTVGVYDHEYFSPLGDALVELYEGLSE